MIKTNLFHVYEPEANSHAHPWILWLAYQIILLVIKITNNIVVFVADQNSHYGSKSNKKEEVIFVPIYLHNISIREKQNLEC